MIDGVDYVGRIENFSEDFADVLSAIAGKPVHYQSDRRVNAAAETNEWRRALTYTAKSAIETVYDADFTLFGYEKLLQAQAA